jgi:regulator of protease activity HflC (stomatin/prohibitin superfamily)
VQSIHTVNNKQQDKHIEAQVWGEAADKTPVYAADVIVTYQVLPEKSAWLYANVSDIKNLVGDELVASAIKSAMAELGPNEVTNRTKIEPLAQQKLAESLVQKYGEDVVFVNKVVINDMNFEDAYNEAIQQKSIAQQNADKQKIENEAAIAKAEADKQVAITNAEAEAQKTSIAADAQAEANRKLAESLSDTLNDYQKVQKWDGKLPTVSGGNALVSIDPAE